MEDFELFINECNIGEEKRWTEVIAPDLFNFPHSCIGYIDASNTEGDKSQTGTGFLISPNLVLTAAHTFIGRCKGDIIDLYPTSFTLI